MNEAALSTIGNFIERIIHWAELFDFDEIAAEAHVALAAYEVIAEPIEPNPIVEPITFDFTQEE